mmetsp:Transcript_40430/g.99895  ORF Transcript_40430/g.99895 Transcript_40430/m.99895 type:complete len:106 (-) Transcript_40430:24-341(-)
MNASSSTLSCSGEKVERLIVRSPPEKPIGEREGKPPLCLWSGIRGDVGISILTGAVVRVPGVNLDSPGFRLSGRVLRPGFLPHFCAGIVLSAAPRRGLQATILDQ